MNAMVAEVTAKDFGEWMLCLAAFLVIVATIFTCFHLWKKLHNGKDKDE